MKDKFKETLSNILSYLLKVERKTLLWTNPNTQSAFPTQYVYLDLSDYDAVEIEVNMYTAATGEYHQMFYGRVGTNLLMSGLIYQTTMPLSRLCEIRSTSILFNDGFANTGNNQAVIPVRIYGIKYGGVLRNPVISRLCAILKIGGGVDESRSQGTVSEHTLTADIKNAARYIKRIIHNDIYDKWEYKRLQNIDRYGIVGLFQSMDNRNRYKGIYNEYPSALSVIGDRIFCLQSVIRLCIANANSSSGKRLWYKWNNSNWHSLTLSERGCAV